MRKFTYFLLLFILLPSFLISQVKMQNIELSYTAENDIVTFQNQTITINVRNNTGTDIILKKVKLYEYDEKLWSKAGVVTTPTLPAGGLTMADGSSEDLELTLIPEHNILHDLGIEFHVEQDRELPNQTYFKIIKNIKVPVNHSNDYYSTTYDLYGEELFNALQDLIDDHTEFTYKEARRVMFGELNNEDGWVETVYIGKRIQTNDIPDVNTTGVNTEHTWPRAYGSADEPELSDMFHIYPTDMDANSKRANFPFGNVTGNISWENGGSKLGVDQNGVLVFDPRDQHKGNVARSLFYFATRYGNKDNFLTYQEPVLRDWMVSDPIDEAEIRRNDIIFQNQKNRNPYIDYPNFLESLQSVSLGKDTSFVKTLGAIYTTDVIVNKNDMSTIEFPLSLRYLEDEFTITDVLITGGEGWLTVSDYSESQGNSISEVIIKVVTDEFFELCNGNSCNVNFVVQTDKGETGIITINFTKGITSVDSKVDDIYLIRNYPNPANGATTIEYKLPTSGFNDASLVITDVLGREIKDLSAEIQLNSSNSGTLQIDTQSLRKHGNVFYYTVRCGSFTQTRILLLN